MAATVPVLPDNDTVVLPFPASTAIDVGQLLYWDSVNNLAKKASARTDLGTAALNQRDFQTVFLGISRDKRLSTETTSGTRVVQISGVCDMTCESSAWEIGDLVGISRNSGDSANYDQQVVKVTNPALAIGVCCKREASATTTVRFHFKSKFWHNLFGVRGIGGFQGTGRKTCTDANTTLVVSDSPVVLMAAGTAHRNITLPAVAQSAGLMFFFVNNNGGAYNMVIKDPDANTLATVSQDKRGIAWCDGTSWFAGAFS